VSGQIAFHHLTTHHPNTSPASVVPDHDGERCNNDHNSGNDQAVRPKLPWTYRNCLARHEKIESIIRSRFLKDLMGGIQLWNKEARCANMERKSPPPAGLPRRTFARTGKSPVFARNGHSGDMSKSSQISRFHVCKSQLAVQSYWHPLNLTAPR